MAEVGDVLAGNKDANVSRFDRSPLRSRFRQEHDDDERRGLKLRVDLPSHQALPQRGAEIDACLKHYVVKIRERPRHLADDTVLLWLSVEHRGRKCRLLL